MAGVSAESFASRVKQVCDNSKIVVRWVVLSESNHQVKLRIYLRDRTVVSVYYNDENGKTGFAQLRASERILGADNATENWHWHPREDPSQHAPSDREITFEEFLKEIENTLK
jgi:hypothetical protein